MPIKKSNAAAVLVASAALVGGGVAIASASSDDTSGTTVPSAGATDKSSYGAREGRGGGVHTEVTGAEKTKVVDAVQAAHDGVTITDVRQDADGSYDALGTQEDGTPVKYDVSADLTTITEHTPGDHRDHRGHGGPGGEDRRGQDGATGAPSESTSLNS